MISQSLPESNKDKQLGSEARARTHFALFPLQVELVLANGHDPNGFNQRVAGIPGVDNQTRLPKGTLGHSPAKKTHHL